MAKFRDISDVEQLDAEALLADKLTKRKKKPVPINVSFVQQGGITFKKGLRGTAGGGIVAKILNDYFDRVLADGGTIEGANCVKQNLYKLT